MDSLHEEAGFRLLAEVLMLLLRKLASYIPEGTIRGTLADLRSTGAICQKGN